MKSIFKNILLLGIALPTVVMAVDTEKIINFYSNLNIPNIEIMEFMPADEKDQANIGMMNALGNLFELKRDSTMFPFRWMPDGTNSYYSSEACDPFTVGARISQSTSKQEIIASINSCEKQWRREGNSVIRSLMSYLNVDYRLSENPYLRPVKIHLPEGTTLRGIIAIKADYKARPFVIARTGIFGSASDNATVRHFIMNYFDASPFNLLVLENISGSEFQKDNQAVAAGGFDEGRQIIEIIDILKNQYSSLARYISSVHVVGVSLGSHGVLYSALYDSQNPSKDGQHRINSATAICPVVNLEPTMKSIFSWSIESLYYRMLTLEQIRSLFSTIPIIGNFLNPEKLNNIDQFMLFKITSDMTFAYYQQQTKDKPWNLRPFMNLSLREKDEFWLVNQYEYYSHLNTVPTLLLYSNDDSFVKPELNAKIIEKDHNNVSKSSTAVVAFKDGSHCALSVAYGWQTMNILLRSKIISASKELHPEIEIFNIPIVETIKTLTPKYRRNNEFFIPLYEKHLAQEWKAFKGQDFLRLSFKIFTENDKENECMRYRHAPRQATFKCFRTMRYKIPLTLIFGRSVKTPETDYEVNALNLWANTNLYLVDTEGKRLIDGRNWPYSIKTLSNLN